MRDDALFAQMRELIPLFEGFLTYGGMSVREMEAIVVGLDETMDEDVISQGPQFIQFMTEELVRAKIPVVTPAGGLGCHLNAMEFLPHVPQCEYPAGGLSRSHIASGVGMERHDERGEPGEALSQICAPMPRRVHPSQVKHAIIASCGCTATATGGLHLGAALALFLETEARIRLAAQARKRLPLGFGDSL